MLTIPTEAKKYHINDEMEEMQFQFEAFFQKIILRTIFNCKVIEYNIFFVMENGTVGMDGRDDEKIDAAQSEHL